MRKIFGLLAILFVIDAYGGWYGFWEIRICDTFRVKPGYYKWRTLYDIYYGDSVYIYIKLLNPALTNVIDEFVFTEKPLFDAYINDYFEEHGAGFGTFLDFYQRYKGIVYTEKIYDSEILRYRDKFRIEYNQGTGTWCIGCYNAPGISGIVDIVVVKVWVKKYHSE